MACVACGDPLTDTHTLVCLHKYCMQCFGDLKDDLKNNKSPKCVADTPSGAMCGELFLNEGDQETSLVDGLTEKELGDLADDLESELRELFDIISLQEIPDRDKMLERLIQHAAPDCEDVCKKLEAISKSLLIERESLLLLRDHLQFALNSDAGDAKNRRMYQLCGQNQDTSTLISEIFNAPILIPDSTGDLIRVNKQIGPRKLIGLQPTRVELSPFLCRFHHAAAFTVLPTGDFLKYGTQIDSQRPSIGRYSSAGGFKDVFTESGPCYGLRYDWIHNRILTLSSDGWFVHAYNYNGQRLFKTTLDFTARGICSVSDDPELLLVYDRYKVALYKGSLQVWVWKVPGFLLIRSVGLFGNEIFLVFSDRFVVLEYSTRVQLREVVVHGYSMIFAFCDANTHRVIACNQTRLFSMSLDGIIQSRCDLPKELEYVPMQNFEGLQVGYDGHIYMTYGSILYRF